MVKTKKELEDEAMWLSEMTNLIKGLSSVDIRLSDEAVAELVRELRYKENKMKRYDFVINLGMRSIIKEDDNGEYVKYEDAVNIISKLVPYHETKAAKDVAERYLKEN